MPFTEPDGGKNLAVLRERLLDFKRTCRAMASLPRRFNPVTHIPEVRQTAKWFKDTKANNAAGTVP